MTARGGKGGGRNGNGSLVDLYSYVFTCRPTGAALADKRVALVIGNNAYTGLAQLDNPVSDAKRIVAELKANGYQVLEAYDVTRERFLDTLERFSRDYASGADEAFVFYAGLA